jgi:hypothetical protein
MDPPPRTFGGGVGSAAIWARTQNAGRYSALKVPSFRVTFWRIEVFSTRMVLTLGVSSRNATRYLYFRIHPRRMQAWREADELEGPELMRYGRWLQA